ncbi:MAG TPA: protein kinase, partial [Thermoanaerobaculia bacterium]
ITGSAREDMYTSQPLLKDLIDSGGIEPLSGVMISENKLYHVAVAPLNVGAASVRPAYLVNAYAIDERFANQIAEATQTGVLFLPSPKLIANMEQFSPRSTNAPSAASLQRMPEIATMFGTAKMIPAHTVEIDRSEYVFTGEPLVASGSPVGAAVFVRSLDTELAPFREIERTLVYAGGAALLLAFILSWLIAKRLTRPIEKLAAIAQAVTEGDYSVQPDTQRTDEVGLLARSFGKMVVALRDKAELEELYEQMSARVEERTGPVFPLKPPLREEGTILVTDLRGSLTTAGGGNAEEVIASIARAMRIQDAEVKRQDGRVREIVGHRLVSVFPGERGVIHAIRACRAISEELSLQIDAAHPLSIGVGIATGDFVSGSVELTSERGEALVGNAPLLALLFAWEAPTSYAYISLESAQAAGNEVMSSASREEVHLKWIPNPLLVASLPLQSLTTGMMQAMNATASMSTLKLEESRTAPSPTPSAEITTGAMFANRYEIEQVLGRGGMGIVYKATDKQLDETVAIKTLPGDVMQRSPEDLERFKREIRLARKITHRNVLRTYDYGEASGVYFISMEYVKGYTLADLLQESPKLAPRVALGVTRQISRGLQAAHEQGIIHRDIKPQNVLIDYRGEVKLMDFGIARMAEATEAMTQAGLIIGTPHYMSPEQVQGKQLDPRSDVYSMGVMVYESLAGARPFEAPSLTGILAAHLTQMPKPLIEVRPDIGAELNAIVMKCLAKNPQDRYADAGELLADLDRVGMSAAAA